MGLEIIQKLKKEKGITTEELSRMSGVPIGTLNKILSGQTKDPKLETLKSLAKVLECTLDDFDDTKRPSSIFTAKELDLISKYRTLDDHGTDVVDVLLEKEYLRCKSIPQIMQDKNPVDEWNRRITEGEEMPNAAR